MSTRYEATLTNPSSALSDFTLAIDLSNMPAGWWSQVDTTDGTRGRAYKGDGTTRLAVDWIDFDDTAETGWAFVKWSGTLATTGTQKVQLDPPNTGNAAVAASDTHGQYNAYDSNWVAFLPLSSDANDRTSNANHGTAQGGITIGGVSGKVGNATDFVPTDDEVDLGSGFGGFGTGAFTVMSWMYPDELSRYQYIGHKQEGEGNYTGWGLRQSTSNKIEFFARSTAAGAFASTGSVSTGTWHHVAGTRSGTSGNVYLDGSATSGTTDSGSVTASGITTTIGGNDIVTTQNLNGRLNDWQAHTAARSSAWINEHRDQTNDNATFWGTWSAVGGGPSTGAAMYHHLRNLGVYA